MNTPKPGLRGALTASATLVVMTMLLGACTSNGTTADTERAAAAAEEQAELPDTEPRESDDADADEVTDDALVEVEAALQSREARVRLRACVSNDSDRGERHLLAWLERGAIELSGDVRPQGWMKSGDRVCGDWVDHYESGTTFNLTINSSYLVSVGSGMARENDGNVMLRQQRPYDQGYRLVCFGQRDSRVPVGYEETWDDGWDRVTIKRVPNSDFPEFAISIATSQSPSPDGNMRTCD
jgi:hypothetical protein